MHEYNVFNVKSKLLYDLFIFILLENFIKYDVEYDVLN